MMGSSLFHACKNLHDPVLIAKESMHLGRVQSSPDSSNCPNDSQSVHRFNSILTKDETEIEILLEKGISAFTNYRNNTRQYLKIIMTCTITLKALHRICPTGPEMSRPSDRLSDVLSNSHVMLVFDLEFKNSKKSFGISRVGYRLCEYGKLGC